jgi:short subunit dehydrogenase-like uncharacterized protein
MTDRQYDVVLYGASGFVGSRTVGYFARHVREGELQWAIAGRDRLKLEAVKASVGGTAAGVDVLLADSHDQRALEAIASRTRVMLNTAGPFALHGDAIVAACVRSRTHYVDITGETAWVRTLIDRHHERAATDGTRIIACCGFDSVPSDLGALVVARHLQQREGTACKGIKAYFQMAGGFNGGTLASGFNAYETGQAQAMRDPFLLNPPGAHAVAEIERSRDVERATYDTDAKAWVAPFFMAPTNTRIVRRSAALFADWGSAYGASFGYQEYLKFDPPLARTKAITTASASALFDAAMRRAPSRRLLKALLPAPGTGPSEKAMDEGWFSCEMLATGEDGRRVRGLMRFQGDPGNRATVTFLCESALALALDTGQLPGGPRRGGILTPATGLGDVLVDRLRKVGASIDVALI